MKSKFTWILTLCLAFFIQFSFAQEKTVTGTVVSKTDKMGMPGVNVVVKGTTRGVQTDFNGNYSIKAAVGQKLEFKFLGSKTQTVTVGASNVVNVTMEEDLTQLGEVVVEGYGITRTKKTSNVASVTVSSKTLEGRPNASFVQSLQGQVAGLNITTGSGQPGAPSSVILRGVGSLTGKVSPLYVIDGVPLSSSDFSSLNPDEIESVSVLKDAGATSIYGSRAASGVIVVKTKKGGYGSALKVRYVGQTGFSTMQSNKYHLMNTQQLLTLEREKGVGQGAGLDWQTGQQGAPMSDDDIKAMASQRNTDWTKVFFRTGVTQNHTLNFTQGSKQTSTFTSIGYFSQEGILKNTDLKRFSLRSNVDGKSKNEKFNYSTNLSLNYSQNNQATSLGSGAINQNYVIGAYMSVPYITPGDYKGTGQQVYDLYGKTGTLITTPLMLLNKLQTFKYTNNQLKGIANIQGSYKIAKNWLLGSNLGIDYTQDSGFAFEDPTSFNALVFFKSQQFKGEEDQFTSRTATFNWNNRLNYNKTFAEKHNVDFTVFTEYFKAHTNGMSFSQNGIDPKTQSPGNGTGYLGTQPQAGADLFVPTVSASAASSGLFSYFAVGDYDYDSRFGFGATIRRDASSRFAQSNRWGTFYSLSGRWNLEREKWMENSAFQVLKLRGSYGTNGNQDIANGTFSALNLTRELYNITSGYQGQPAYALQQLANPNLKWETSVQGNVGVDFEVFKSKFRGSVDLYNKKTLDLYQPLPLSAVTGQAAISTNFGDMYNRGVELLLAYDAIKNGPDGFNLTLKANGSYNKNRITSIPSVKTVVENGKPVNVVDNGSTVNAEGHRLNEFYLVRYAGVNPADGNLLFLDKNGHPTENPDQTNDRVFTGKSAIPVYQGGFGFDADYKGFFINTQFTFVADVWRLDYQLNSFQDVTDIGVFNKSTDLLRAWTPTNTHTDIPSLNYTNTSADGNSDRYLRDASYLRLKFASFGYMVPKKMLTKTPFTMLKVYFNAENYLTWSKWRGNDAESNRSADYNNYPTPKIASFGLNLEF